LRTADGTESNQVFHVTPLSFAFVNFKPLLPGHVLVSPIRRVPRINDLTTKEVTDLFLTVQRVGRMVERVYNSPALNIAIQDGPAAGQSVPHVHAHIIPRKLADLPPDEIYKKLEGPEGNIGRYLSDAERSSFPTVHPEEDRAPRSEAEMMEEAQTLAAEMDLEDNAKEEQDI
jgi:diadenosine tetraphosphate (Ap4A) HIT family hydrolase